MNRSDAYDVVVAGGGPAGVAAALAAARNGAKTLLLEQFNCLGGVATAGGHAHISKYCEGGGRRRIVGGIADEIAERIVNEGYGSRNPHGIFFEIERLKLMLERMMGESGVDLLYHSFIAGTEVKDGTVTGVIVQNKSGRYVIPAGRIVDCTGDGDVAAGAGCDWEMGRPADSRCQPVTLMFTVGGVEWARVQEFCRKYRAENPDDGESWKLKRVYSKAIDNGDMEPYQTGNMGWWWTPTRPDQVGVNFTHVIYIDSTKAEDLTRATLVAREQAWKTIDVYRKYIPGMENCYMISTPATIGIRESRRIMGEYIMTDEDIKKQAEFTDGIAYGSFFVDIHCIDGPGMDPTTWHPPEGFKYQIPYRALVPKKIDGLLVAGRCLSASHVALGSLRVMVTCLAMGEAAGTAAAMSLKSGVQPRGLLPGLLRSGLQAQGMILDDDDIAAAVRVDESREWYLKESILKR